MDQFQENAPSALSQGPFTFNPFRFMIEEKFGKTEGGKTFGIDTVNVCHVCPTKLCVHSNWFVPTFGDPRAYIKRVLESLQLSILLVICNAWFLCYLGSGQARLAHPTSKHLDGKRGYGYVSK